MDGESAGGGEGGGDASDSTLNEQQQLAMQQEERVLTEQIESLQKEKYDARKYFLSRAAIITHLHATSQLSCSSVNS